MKLIFPPKKVHPTPTTTSTTRTIALSAILNSPLSLLQLKSYHHHHIPTHLNSLLNKTNQTKNLRHATQLHAQIVAHNFTSSLPFLFNNLLNLYANCGRIDQTLLLFSTSSCPHHVDNVITWTILITQLSRSDKHSQALQFFNRMRSSCAAHPNAHVFSATLSACAASAVLFHVQQMHSLVLRIGLGADLFVGSALVDAYAKCGEMGLARGVFDEMPERNLVSWNSLIVGFLRNGFYDAAIGSFKEALGQGSESWAMSPDQVSCSSVLSACANIGALEFGRAVHGVVVKNGLVNLAYVGNSLMDMYCKCGLFDEAAMLFEAAADRDVVAWNVMIMGCFYCDKFEEACKYFRKMRREGVLPDEASYSSVLHASASSVAQNQGALVHGQTIKFGFVQNSCVSSSLITMYAKSGSLSDAYRVFEEIENRNVVCWTAMIAACQQHGRANQVIELFEEMLEEGIKPEYVTFVSVLSACSHTGRVEEAYCYFHSMERVHRMSPMHEHYACMVDLLGRVGRLDEAKKFVESMPIKPNSSVWGALLGACTNYGNLELGREAAERLFELEPENPGNYVLLSNMYALNGRLKEADEVRRLMEAKGIKKEPGCSWLDIRNSTFAFKAHDRSHPRTDEIYKMLTKLEDRVAYVAETKMQMAL